jgi:hypothetical protein
MAFLTVSLPWKPNESFETFPRICAPGQFSRIHPQARIKFSAEDASSSLTEERGNTRGSMMMSSAGKAEKTRSF